MTPARASAASKAVGGLRSCQRTAPPSAFSTTVPERPPPKFTLSPVDRRRALRTKLHHSCRPRRWCSVTPMVASPRLPPSCAGMTRVSLKTRMSPRHRRDGKSRMPRSVRPHGATSSSRETSRGTAGRSAMRSGGRSKSKSATRIGSLCHPAAAGNTKAYFGGTAPDTGIAGIGELGAGGGTLSLAIDACRIFDGLAGGSPRSRAST